MPAQKTCPIIAFPNIKGGVGKTTIAYNVASCLVNMGQRVLLIDADPQGNLTRRISGSASIVQNDSNLDTLLSVFKDPNFLIDNAIYTFNDYFHLISSHPDLSAHSFFVKKKRSSNGKLTVEIDSDGNLVYLHDDYLKKRLDELSPFFDIIIIDTNPSSSPLLYQVLHSCSHVFPCITCSVDSVEGLVMLYGTLEELKGINGLKYNKVVVNMCNKEDQLREVVEMIEPAFTPLAMLSRGDALWSRCDKENSALIYESIRHRISLEVINLSVCVAKECGLEIKATDPVFLRALSRYEERKEKNNNG